MPLSPPMLRSVLPTASMVMMDASVDASARTTMMADADASAGSSKEVLAVALPILGACLAEPLLSMIDTACVGRLSGMSATVGLAALNVNVAIFNMVACCTSFLCTATTAVVGRARSSSEVDGDVAAANTLRDGLVIASSLGTLLMLLVLAFHGAILEKGFGLLPSSETWLPATRYLQIRALSLPAVASTLVAVGVSLGMQDVVTPLLGVLLAFAVNVIGDVYPRVALQLRTSRGLFPPPFARALLVLTSPW